MDLKRIKSLFVIAAIYDLVIGAAFLFLNGTIFTTFNLAPMGHPSYAQFPALLVVTFGVMFLQISKDPILHRSMIPYGMALKAAFTGVAILSVLTVGLPALWITIAVFDTAFLIAFIVAWNAIPRLREHA